jgi:sugar/nucleoside kinase (ribokinase family)
MSTYRVIGIANPFHDRAAPVEAAFLEKYKLPLGATEVRDRSEIVASWNEAHQGEYQWTLGGSGTNVIKTAAHLGSKGEYALYGKIGDDEIGRKMKAAIEEAGITSLHTTGKNGTPIANCFVSKDVRTIMANAGAAGEISPEEINPEMFRGAEMAYIEGYLAFFGKTMEWSVDCARRVQVPVAVGLPSHNVVGLFNSEFQKSAAKADLIFGNGLEVMKLTGKNTVQEALGSFDSSKTVFATVKADGCWVRERGKSDAVHFPARPVPKVVDPTGAGDFFTGAVLAALRRGLPLPECINWGNHAAGYVIQEQGAELPPAKWSELRQALRV